MINIKSYFTLIYNNLIYHLDPLNTKYWFIYEVLPNSEKTDYDSLIKKT